MDDSKNIEINWLNILFNKEFQSYLELELSKKISLLSKLTRKKLSPLLFNNLELSEVCRYINYNNSVIIEYYKRIINPRYISKIPKENGKLSIQTDYNNISFFLNEIKVFAKCFGLIHLKKAGYFLFPIIKNFDNLSELKINDCFIPYSGFLKLGETLPLLKSLELTKVVLAKLPAENLLPTDFIFHQNLINLKIINCEVADTDLLLDPYEFFFSYDKQITSYSFTLPKISAPSLKSLSFIGYDDQSSGLKQFIELNPNLECLNIEYFNSDLLDSLISLRSLEIGSMIGFKNNIEITTLESVKKLKIDIDGPFFYKYGKILCQLCPNVIDLHFIMRNMDSFKNSISFLIPILSNLQQIITLHFAVFIEADGSSYMSDDSEISSNSDESNGSVSLDIGDEHDSLYIYDRTDNFDISESYESSHSSSNNCNLNNNLQHTTNISYSNFNFPTITNIIDIQDIIKNSNIKKLILETEAETILNFKFNNSESLKFIEFKSYSKLINTEGYRKKFNGITNWVFKYSEHTIKGYKLKE